jgi:hypothetical protein
MHHPVVTTSSPKEQAFAPEFILPGIPLSFSGRLGTYTRPPRDAIASRGFGTRYFSDCGSILHCKLDSPLNRVFRGDNPAATESQAVPLPTQALALDNTLAEAHFALGNLEHSQFTGLELGLTGESEVK